VTIRPARSTDRREVENLVFSILRSYGREPSPKTTDADLADIEGTYRENGGCFDVLVDDSNRIVGTVAVHRTSEDLCELRKMYLDPSARGGGKGRMLLEHAISRARELGFPRMWLETADCLTEATRLYRSYGFEEWNPPHLSHRCDLAMVKDLG